MTSMTSAALVRASALVLLTTLAACARDQTATAPPAAAPPTAPAAAPRTAPAAAPPESAAEPMAPAAAQPESAAEPMAHDPMHPPIDCPLRKQGLDPAHMRPFEDVEQYIAFLERADRAAWQRPDEVVAALGLGGDETVVDLGAGSGYFSFRLARALPQGKVIAADPEAEMVRHIHHKSMTNDIRNVHATLIGMDDPAVPAETDLVFVCDVLHHVADRPAWLGKLSAPLRSGARVALIEFKEGTLPEGPPESLKIPRDELVRLMTEAGLELTAERADLLPYQTFLMFRKP